MPDDQLEEIGVARGDIIRMKKGSVKWYHGADRKRKIATASGPPGGPPGGPPDDPPPETTPDNLPRNKRVRYERRYPDGGAQTWHAPPPVTADAHYPDITYCVSGVMVPLPAGFAAGVESDEEDFVENN